MRLKSEVLAAKRLTDLTQECRFGKQRVQGMKRRIFRPLPLACVEVRANEMGAPYKCEHP